MNKIAVFGGSFDPIHLCHEKIVKKVLNELKIKKLFIVPTFLNRFKQNYFFSPKLRFRFLKQIFRTSNLKILNYEIRQKKPTPTYKTILFIKKEYNPKKIYLIIGADNLKTIKLWYNYKRLKKIVEFIIINRPNYKISKKYKIINLECNISSTKIKKEFLINKIPKKIQKGVIKNWKGLKGL